MLEHEDTQLYFSEEQLRMAFNPYFYGEWKTIADNACQRGLAWTC